MVLQNEHARAVTQNLEHHQRHTFDLKPSFRGSVKFRERRHANFADTVAS
jgi:hypothetical protein